MKNKSNYGAGMLRVLIHHTRWLEDQGPSYKQQAASAKRQALDLTRKQYRSIKDYEKDKKQT
tara:strand:+ start:445 stop:630 length:186 start_codon:yes stop_codon:yes gene_type:complete